MERIDVLNYFKKIFLIYCDQIVYVCVYIYMYVYMYTSYLEEKKTCENSNLRYSWINK